jgi:hypothetical protein
MPLNLIGGHRWRGSIAVDLAMVRKIVRREIGGAVVAAGAAP